MCLHLFSKQRLLSEDTVLSGMTYSVTCGIYSFGKKNRSIQPSFKF